MSAAGALGCVFIDGGRGNGVFVDGGRGNGVFVDGGRGNGVFIDGGHGNSAGRCAYGSIAPWWRRRMFSILDAAPVLRLFGEVYSRTRDGSSPERLRRLRVSALRLVLWYNLCY